MRAQIQPHDGAVRAVLLGEQEILLERDGAVARIGKHMERYCKEFEYRFNRRMTPSMMFDELTTRFPDLQKS